MSQTEFTKAYTAKFSDISESTSACEQIIRDIVAVAEGVTLHSLETTSSGQGEVRDVTVNFEVSLKPQTITGRTVQGTLARHARSQPLCDGIVEQGANPMRDD